MIDSIQRTLNFHRWLLTGWPAFLSDNTKWTKAELYEAFRRSLIEKIGEAKEKNSSANLLRIARYGFINDDELRPLTLPAAEKLIKLYLREGLTLEILNAEPVSRSLYIVLANISFSENYSMESFLDTVYEETPFVETACAVFGNHDCIFNLYATQKEIEKWLWVTLRSYKSVTAVTTMTYQTYSTVRNRFDARKHPDYNKVLNQRWIHQTKQTNE